MINISGVHVNEIGRQVETRRDTIKAKQNILKDEGKKDASAEEKQMGAAERLYYIVTTDIHKSETG